MKNSKLHSLVVVEEPFVVSSRPEGNVEETAKLATKIANLLNESIVQEVRVVIVDNGYPEEKTGKDIKQLTDLVLNLYTQGARTGKPKLANKPFRVLSFMKLLK